MKFGAAAVAGGAIRPLLTWILVLLVLANIVVWTAWPVRDKLVAQGILAPPPAERVDLDPQALPPIVERIERARDAEGNPPPRIDREDLDPQGVPPIEERVGPAPESEGVQVQSSIEGSDLDTEALPSIEEHADPVPDDDQTHEPRYSEETEDIGRSIPPEDTGRPVPPDRDPRPASPAAPRLVGEASVPGQPTSSALLGCVIVGPIESQALEGVETRLRSAGAVVGLLEEADLGPPEYLVYVEPAASREAAWSILREMETQMIEDAEVLYRGPNENGVAVGVYRNRNLADARRDEIAALGYAVKVRVRQGARLRARDVPALALGDLPYEPCPDEAG